jgi:hypothetical protein
MMGLIDAPDHDAEDEEDGELLMAAVAVAC